MAKRLSAFAPIEGLEGWFTATRDGLRSTAIVLASGGLCLHSPVAGLSPAARDSLGRLGPVRFLLAPNHYHNKGLGEYLAAFPEARIVAPAASRQRLGRVTGLDVDDMELLLPHLTGAIRVVSPPGLKTGEIWLVAPIGSGAGGGNGWLVVDAFAGPRKGSEGVHLLGTFPTYGIADRTAYARWLGGFLKTEPPRMLIPCHGDMVRDPALPAHLSALMARPGPGASAA